MAHALPAAQIRRRPAGYPGRQAAEGNRERLPERRQRVLDVRNGHDIASDSDVVAINLAGKMIMHSP